VRRRATNLSCLFSLLVFAGSVTLGVRSYFVGEDVQWQDQRVDAAQGPFELQTRVYRLRWTRGTVALFRIHAELHFPGIASSAWQYARWSPTQNAVQAPTPADRLNLRLGGFQVLSMAWRFQTGRTSEQRLVLPLWLFLPFAIPPTLWLRQWRRSRGRGFPVDAAKPTAAESKGPAETTAAAVEKI
jgi:hypothetical protein